MTFPANFGLLPGQLLNEGYNLGYRREAPTQIDSRKGNFCLGTLGF